MLNMLHVFIKDLKAYVDRNDTELVSNDYKRMTE